MDTYHYEGEVSWKTILRPHGRGTLTCYAEGGGPGAEDAFSWRYEGEFKQGRATGQGTTTYGELYEDPDLRGGVYSGAHENGEAHGQGTWYYPGGAVQYVGDHQGGYCHGQGTWYYPDGAVEYVGDHQKGECHGHGTSYRRDGTRQYEGTWQEGYWTGNGTLYRPDGSISREGKWVNGNSDESKWQGEACWYEGDWDKGNLLHGWGILYRPDRITVVREGWWQNNEPVDGPPPGYPDAP